MPDANTLVKSRRPNPVQDGLIGESPRRLSPYGDSVIYQPVRAALSDEGSYYTVVNPTIDTPVVYGIITAYVATTPMFLICNTATAVSAGGTGRSIFLDFVKVRITTGPASATNWKFVVDIDTTTRLSTAPTGGVSRVVNNINPGMGNDFEGQVWAFSGGTVLTVMAASAQARTIAHGSLAQSVPLVLDELVILFGQGDAQLAPSGTAVTRRLSSAPPCVIPPGCSAAIHQYGTSNGTALQGEYSLGMWQR